MLCKKCKTEMAKIDCPDIKPGCLVAHYRCETCKSTKNVRDRKEVGKKYRMPGGSYAKDAPTCLEAWTEMGRDLGEALGGDWELVGFDPDLEMMQKSKKGKRFVAFDVDIAERIIELHKYKLTRDKMEQELRDYRLAVED